MRWQLRCWPELSSSKEAEETNSCACWLEGFNSWPCGSCHNAALTAKQLAPLQRAWSESKRNENRSIVPCETNLRSIVSAVFYGLQTNPALVWERTLQGSEFPGSGAITEHRLRGWLLQSLKMAPDSCFLGYTIGLIPTTWVWTRPVNVIE